MAGRRLMYSLHQTALLLHTDCTEVANPKVSLPCSLLHLASMSHPQGLTKHALTSASSKCIQWAWQGMASTWQHLTGHVAQVCVEG